MFFHSHGVNQFDLRAYHRIVETFGPRLLRWSLKITTPGLIAGVIGAALVAALLRQRHRLAVVAAVGPALAVALNEWVWKPLVGRFYAMPGVSVAYGSYAYPSGHQTGVASATALLTLAVFVCVRSVAWRAVAVGAALGADAVAAIALIGNRYHFATDTIGAIALASAEVLGVALLVDVGFDRLNPMIGRSRSAGMREPGSEGTGEEGVSGA
jgi:undecaprenyl-diphosphatase